MHAFARPSVSNRLCLAAFLALGTVAAPLSYASELAAFQALHGEGVPASSILGTFNKNRLVSEVHAFYSKVDRRVEPEALLEHVDGEHIHSAVTFVKTLKESHGFEGFATTLQGVYDKYPLVDRTLDQFEVTQLDEQTYSVRFRLTSVILRPKTGRVHFAFRAAMRFDYRIGADGQPRIVEYLATPSLSTISKSLWELIKDMF